MIKGRAFFRVLFFLAILVTALASLSWGQCSGTTTAQTCTFTGLAVTVGPDLKASTYPLQAAPTTLAGPVKTVSVSITGITETGGSANFGGAQLLLVAPNGTQLAIWARGGDAFSTAPTSFTVDDGGTDSCAGLALPGTAHVQAHVCGGSLFIGGGPGGAQDGFPNVLSPGTSCTHTSCAVANPPSITMNNTFNAVANANGTWSLYVINNTNDGASGVSIDFTGWSISFTTAGGSAAATTTAVSPASTTVTRTPPNPSNPATITATVSSTSTVNSGTVTFSDNGTPVTCSGGNQTVANGSATCAITFTQEGIHPITASYAGNSSFAPSNSPSNSPANVTVTNNTTVNGNSYCNVGNLAIPATGSSFGIAGPYPSQIFVGVNGSPNLTGVITNLTVDLKQIHHQQSDSPSLLLVSPAGVPYMLMAVAYSSTGGGPVDITLSDAAATQLPAGPGLGFTAGTFRPADYNQSASQDQGVFPTPAPQSGFLFPTPLGSSQPSGPSTIGQAFDGAGATGTWQLFVLNNAGGSGAINNGWCLNFTVNPNLHASTTTISASPTQSYTTAPFTSQFPPTPANDFVTLTATTTSDTTVNAGSVTFTEDGVNLSCAFGTSNPASVSGNTAICKTTFTAEGNHNIRATFHDAGATFGDSHGNALERADSHSTRTPTSAVTYQYCNPGQVTIPGGYPSSVAAAPANPYPSNIFINDLPGTINKVTLSLPDFVVQSVAIRDVTSLLVGPNQNIGDSLDLFSHVGTNAAVFTAAYTLDDAAGATLTQASNPSSGTYRPASFGSPTYPSLSPVGPDPPPSGTPQYAAPSGTSTFAGVYGSGTGNTRVGTGTWSLFQQSTVNGTTIFEGNGANEPSWCLNFTVNPPDLSLQHAPMTHSPTIFTRGQSASFTVTATDLGPGPSGGTITITDTLPVGLTFTSGTGTGWTCGAVGQVVTCTNPNSLALNGSSAVTINATVGAATADIISNSATLTGGGDDPATTANDTTTSGNITVAGTILTINKTHSDPFTQGQVGATYTITLHNSGAAGTDSGPGLTAGAIQVTDSIPSNLTPTAFSGAGWTCQPVPTLMCTLNSALAVNGNATITLTANVSNTMLGPVTNTAILTATTDQIGPAGDNQHGDVTNITQVPTQIAANANTSGQSAQINNAFGTLLSVTVKDAGNNPVQGVSVTFTPPGSGATGAFTAVSNGTQTCTAASCVVTTNVSGVATASAFTANSKAGGPYLVKATASSLEADFSLTNKPGPAATVAISTGGGQSATISTQFTNPLVALVTDSGSNPVPNVIVTFTAPAQTGASATFAGGTNTATTNASGLATSVAVSANSHAGGPYNVVASAPGAGTSANFSLTNTTGSPATVAVSSGNGQSATISTQFTNPLVAFVTDSGGNPVPNVVVTFTAPAQTGPSVTFAGGTNTATTNASGLATSAAITANGHAGGSYNVVASAAGAGTSANFSLTNTTGSPGTVAVSSGSGQSATISTGFTNPLVALVTDSGGNPVSNVVVTFTAPAQTGPSVTFAGGINTATTNASGLATSAAITANGHAGGSYNVVASAPGAGTSANFSLTNTTGSPGTVAVSSGSGQSATISTGFTNPLVALVTDSGGNPVPNVVVTFTAPPQTGPSVTFAGGINTATTNASGLASVAVSANSHAGGLYNVVASTPGATSANFSLTNTAASGGPTVVSFSLLFGSQSYNVIGSLRNRLPWQVTGIQVVFSSPITSGDINSLTGVSTTSFSGLGTNTLTWGIMPISMGNVSAMLAGSGMDALTDSNSNGLNGGAGFTQNFRVLEGDFNDDGIVNSLDVVGVNNATVKPYNILADINGDGAVNINDVRLVRSLLGTSLP